MSKLKTRFKKAVFKGFYLDYVKNDTEFGFWNPKTNEYIVVKAVD